MKKGARRCPHCAKNQTSAVTAVAVLLIVVMVLGGMAWNAIFPKHHHASESPLIVSTGCASAWVDYAQAFNDETSTASAEATAVLNACQTPDEWWAGSAGVRDQVGIGANDTESVTLANWCAAETGPTATCASS